MFTPVKRLNSTFAISVAKAFKVSRIRNEYILAALGHHREAVPLQRKDVVQRQRRDRNYRLHAGVGIGLPNDTLLHVVDHVAMAEHRASRNACSAARVLQKSDIGITEFDLIEHFSSASFECLFERELIVRIGTQAPTFLMWRRTKLVSDALRPAEQIADARGYDMRHISFGDDLFERVREIFQDQECTWRRSPLAGVRALSRCTAD